MAGMGGAASQIVNPNYSMGIASTCNGAFCQIQNCQVFLKCSTEFNKKFSCPGADRNPSLVSTENFYHTWKTFGFYRKSRPHVVLLSNQHCLRGVNRVNVRLKKL